ncbi:glycosylase [Pedobacter sp. SYP-B3415]|uniref:glycosylase n=1 Tax=Pedobacter sp. SYP-B3415 TaxID=2496641 RepID=UPI00101C3A82|nr:glycosylase [Pedobacter sp. SYP-B3415]
MKISWLIVILVFLAYPRLYAQKTVSSADMQRIYTEVRTPHKYGLVLVPADTTQKIDCPTIYRRHGKWFMTYLVFNGRGYETWLATSGDLLNWQTLGRQLSFSEGSWDASQKAGYNALVDTRWGGSYALGTYKNRYWMSYFGGREQGYEPEPLSIGVASVGRYPDSAVEWEREAQPVLSAADQDVRWWENRNKLFKSTVIEDKSRLTGHRFVMYYNAVGDSLKNNKKTRWYERIGMAVSNDMRNWKRFGKDPVMHHPVGITGDASIQKIGRLWVMFYFGAFWQDRPGAYNRFAVSEDLIHWTDWQGDNLIESSEPYDALYAHKSCVIKHRGIVYHFYCAVDRRDQRGIAVATSVDLGKSTIQFKTLSPGK